MFRGKANLIVGELKLKLLVHIDKYYSSGSGLF